MATTKTLFGSAVQKKVKEAIDLACGVARLTMGPEGRNVLVPRSFNRGVRITNDGHAVVQVQEPKDEFVKAITEVVKDAVSKTNARAGDGTTGTAALVRALYLEAEKRLSENSGEIKTKIAGHGTGVMTLRREILAEADKVKELVLKSSHKIEKLEELEKIATVSVEDPDLGKIIAQMAWDVGVDGFIDVVEGYKGEVETDVMKGMRFPAKVPARAFVNNPARYEMVAQDAPVLVTNYALDNAAQLSFTRNLKTAKLIIFAPSFSDNVALALVQAIKNGFHVFPVAIPALRTDQLEDLSTYCGGVFINKEKGKKLESVTENDLGFLEKLIVKETESKEDAVATGGAGTRPIVVADFDETKGKKERKGVKDSTPVEERVKVLKAQLGEQKTEVFKKLLERRIASMASGVGIIRVGAPSDTELYYKKLKIEDAVYACRAALKNGYVKGAGLCLKDIADALPPGHLLKEALCAPYNQIRDNAERELEVSADIIDATDAIYWAVENASSVVAHLITLGAITVEVREKDQAEGLEAIAGALNFYNRLWNKKESIYRENQLEMEGDRIRLQEELEAGDQG